MFVKKRDGRIVEFDQHKIGESIKNAALAVEGKDDDIQHRANCARQMMQELIESGYKVDEAQDMVLEGYEGYFENSEYTEIDTTEIKSVVDTVMDLLSEIDDSMLENDIDESVSLIIQDEDVISTSVIQKLVEKALVEHEHFTTSREYILFRGSRDKITEMNSELMRTYENITFGNSKEVELKRENANINGDSAMGTMLRYGSEGAKKFNLLHIIPPEISKEHKNGDIHIHDLDFYSITETCCQIPLDKLFNNGFNTGHGFLREPNDIVSYSALAAIAIQSNQNEQHKSVA